MSVEEEKRGREQEEKRKGKGRKKCGLKSFFVHAHVFFHMRSGQFLGSIKKTVSRVSKLYPLLFAIKSLIVSQLGGLYRPNIHPYPPISATFSNSSGRPKDMIKSDKLAHTASLNGYIST